MFGFLKKPRAPKPNEKWLKWLTVVFLAYALFANNFASKPATTPDATHTPEENLNPLSVETVKKDVLQLDTYQNKLLPQPVQKLSVIDTLVVGGSPVGCGQKATIAYKAFLADDTEIVGDTLTFTIGENTALPAFEQGIIGMSKGSARSIISPASFAYDITAFKRDDVPAGASVRFDVQLLEISPVFPEKSGFRIFGDTAENNSSARCGQLVKLHVVISDMEGKKLFSTRDEGKQPVLFTPGKSQVFVGLEQGVLGLRAGQMRSLIIPPHLQKTLHGNAPAIDFPLSKKQTVLVDIESVP